MTVDWTSSTWGHNPIHEDSHGSWTTAEEAERDGGAA